MNELGKTERLTVEAILFTFGKGAKDQARAGALVAVAELAAERALEEAGLRGIRVWTIGDTLFEAVDAAESKGLGAYRVGLRVEDETLQKVDVRYRRSIGAVINAVVESVSKLGSWLRGKVYG